MLMFKCTYDLSSGTSAISERVIEDFFTDLYSAEPVAAPTTSTTRPSRSKNAFFKNMSSTEKDRIEGIACSTLQVINNLVFDLFDLFDLFDFDCYEYIVSLLFTELTKVVADKYSRKNINKSTYENTLLAIEVLEAVCSSLTVSLYLECAKYRDFPSYKHQLLLIRDFRQLLENTEPKPQYIHLSDYRHCYNRLCLFLSERIHYAESGTLSETFFSKLLVNNESFPIEHAKKYLDYTEEMTRVVIEAVTKN